ncbi:MAG: carboxypeptidase regulatory-like domain-containing protein, partial [Planctomycetes bacterium]|nr:carboxypeptidase regulatory-like domain-containing protein [Planctomycetota bacterium]
EVGTLRFANLPTGRWTVLLWPEGWQPEHREVEVRAGVETKLEVICRPGHRLSGTVQDQAGRPVKEAWISVQPAELLLAGHGIGLHGVSDAKGRFSFAGLPEGEVRLEVKLHLHVFLRLTVPAGTEGLVITLWEQPELRGRVRLEPGEPAPAEVKVWILEEFGASVPTVTLEPDGSFRAGVESKPLELGRWSGQSPPPAGREVRVVVQIAGWPPAEARTVRIAPGESTDLGEYSRPPGRVVQGRVLGPDGRPAAGAQVSLEFLRGRVALSAAVREDGSFRVENAPPWEGELRVDGGPDLPFVRRFLPAAGDAPIDVRLGRGGRIRGRVTDVAGRPVEGTTVLLTHVRTPGGDELYVGMGTSMTTGQDGGFLSRAVPPDTYRLQVFAGDEHAGPEVAVREGETTIADIRLPVSIRR